MAWPLLDYSNYLGDLTKFDLKSLPNNMTIDPVKLEKSPRFVQLDEIQLFMYLRSIISLDDKSGSQPDDTHSDFTHPFAILPNFPHNKAKKQQNPRNNHSKETENEMLKKAASHIMGDDVRREDLIERADGIYELRMSFPFTEQKAGEFCIGIVNMKVAKEDIEASYNPRKHPEKTYDRQENLFNLINLGLKEPVCDLIIFPEVSIPYEWLPFMVRQSRRRGIGFVFGVEHMVIGNYALNLVATVLPFKNNHLFKNVYLSLRLKNHYSPKEEHELSLFSLSRPPYKYMYEKFCWRGVEFSVYNCYELTDIIHRGLFRSDIDLLIAVEYNPDISYFSNIIESATRDIHCYTAQANSSDYGDSRVISPQQTEKMNVIRVKGGENAVLLKTKLNIEALRDFQSRKYSPSHNEFKPTPAGYENRKVADRGKS